ncbi:MAG: dUTP diphosphatase [Clostridia bacterium]|nr:dUTP diphosphatase [Clostridia bacterium]
MRKFELVKEEFRKNKDGLVKMPVRATKHSAGYDIFSPIDTVIEPQTMQMIWTDMKAEFNTDEVLLLCVTSGMGKNGIMVANTIGVIDCDYYSNSGNDGNLGFRLYNYSNEPYVIKAGDKIGQGIFMKFLTVDNEQEITSERKGGFGSTVKK